MASELTLHHELVSAPDSAPDQWLLVLHGIFGSGVNWRTFAKRLVGRRPAWGAVLVDLRMHGQSQGAPPPHTVAAAAADVAALAAALEADGRVVGGVCGHSFGGKVGLQLAADAAGAVPRVWVLDSDPAADTDAMASKRSTASVLRMLEQLPREYPTRAAFVSRVVETGVDRGLAQWLAMNVVPDGDEFRLRLDMAAMRSLLASYYATDLWPAADAVAGQSELHFVLGADSTAVSEASKVRMRTLRATVDEIAAAGHWLHVDAPDALLDIIATGLTT
jgi:pimeloyl-ACP methyl ester carboxylesterase